MKAEVPRTVRFSKTAEKRILTYKGSRFEMVDVINFAVEYLFEQIDAGAKLQFSPEGKIELAKPETASIPTSGRLRKGQKPGTQPEHVSKTRAGAA